MWRFREFVATQLQRYIANFFGKNNFISKRLYSYTVMTIPLFFGDARGKHGYADTKVQIPSCFIAKENYFQSQTLLDWAVSDAEQFPIIIKQFMEVFRRDRPKIFNWLGAQAAISPENAQLDQNIRLQLMQSDNLIADNWQLTLDEVFHVHS